MRIGVCQRYWDFSLYTTLPSPHLEYCIHLWVPQHQKNTDLLRVVPEEGHEDDQGSEEPLL